MLAAPYLAEFGGSQKGQSLISAYQSLAITTDTLGFEKLNTALVSQLFLVLISSLIKLNREKCKKYIIRRHCYSSISVLSITDKYLPCRECEIA